jgi:hypothetical protein
MEASHLPQDHPSEFLLALSSALFKYVAIHKIHRDRRVSEPVRLVGSISR